MNHADAGAKSERRLFEPSPQWRLGLIFNNSGGQRLWSEGQKISDPTCAANKLNIAAESSGSDIESVVDQQTARGDERTFAQVERLSVPERIREIGSLAEKPPSN